MGRYDFSAQKVHAHATQLLRTKRIAAPPPWFNTVGNIPAAEVLTRRPMQRSGKTRKASKLFKPLQLQHQEDDLRWEFFNDHPWELARPRIVVENDGRDHERWDWSHALCRPTYNQQNANSSAEVRAWEAKEISQASRPLNGESVIQRQRWLMQHTGMSKPAAYDKARKELYAARHAQEVEQRIAKEEATYYGGEFDLGAIDVGMLLEDRAYENWRNWAAKEITAFKRRASSVYTGEEAEENATETSDVEFDEMVDALPGTRAGQTALGGAAIHP